MSKRLTLHEPQERSELAELLKQAVAKFEALSPEEKREHRRAQRRSWVIGEMLLEHPEMSREYAEKIYDQIEY